MSTLTLPAQPGTDRFLPKSLESLFLADPRRALAMCAACFVAVAAADFLTPVQLNLTFAYVCILVFVGWHGGVKWGLGFAMAAFCLQIVNVSLGAEILGSGIYAHIHLANRLFSFLV